MFDFEKEKVRGRKKGKKKGKRLYLSKLLIKVFSSIESNEYLIWGIDMTYVTW